VETGRKASSLDILMNDQELSPEEMDEAIEQTKQRQREKHANGLKTPIEIKCIVCEKTIHDSFPDCQCHELARDYADHASFYDGAVGTISFGYGSEFDCDVFIIGICVDCYKIKQAANIVLKTHNYMP
jgi:hypothetical protein